MNLDFFRLTMFSLINFSCATYNSKIIGDNLICTILNICNIFIMI